MSELVIFSHGGTTKFVFCADTAAADAVMSDAAMEGWNMGAIALRDPPPPIETAKAEKGGEAKGETKSGEAKGSEDKDAAAKDPKASQSKAETTGQGTGHKGEAHRS